MYGAQIYPGCSYMMGFLLEYYLRICVEDSHSSKMSFWSLELKIRSFSKQSVLLL